MAQIIETLKNCTIATVAKSATLSNGNLTYTASGKPGTNIHLFSKTVTRSSGYVFSTEPLIDFKSTEFPQNYSVVIADTGATKTNNLTVRKFDVYYKLPQVNSSSDTIKISAKAELLKVASTGKISGFDLVTGTLSSVGGKRELNIYGDPGATVTLEVKETTANPDVNTTTTTSTVASNESGTRLVTLTLANPNIHVGMTVTGTNIASNTVVSSINGTAVQVSNNTTGSASGTLTFSGSFTATIGENGVFTKLISFPSTTANKSYSAIITRIANDSFVGGLAGLSTKTITVLQFPQITLTATLVNNSSNSGDWSLVAPAAIDIVGQASQEDIVFPVKWVVRAAQAGEISQTTAGFSTAAFTSNATASGSIQIGSDASTATFVFLSNAKVEISNITTFSNLACVGSSGTNKLTLTAPQSLFYVGLPVTGTNIPGGATITAIGPGYQEITLSASLTGNITAATFPAKPFAVISGNIRSNQGKANVSTNIEVNSIITLTT